MTCTHEPEFFTIDSHRNLRCRCGKLLLDLPDWTKTMELIWDRQIIPAEAIPTAIPVYQPTERPTEPQPTIEHEDREATWGR